MFTIENRKSINLVKETIMTRSINKIVAVLVLSIICNAALVGISINAESRANSNEQLFIQTVKALQLSVEENASLKVKLYNMQDKYYTIKAKHENALIPETTVTEAVNNKVVTPVKSFATNAAETVKHSVKSSYEYAKDKVNVAWEYVKK